MKLKKSSLPAISRHILFAGMVVLTGVAPFNATARSLIPNQPSVEIRLEALRALRQTTSMTRNPFTSAPSVPLAIAPLLKPQPAMTAALPYQPKPPIVAVAPIPIPAPTPLPVIVAVAPQPIISAPQPAMSALKPQPLPPVVKQKPVIVAVPKPVAVVPPAIAAIPQKPVAFEDKYQMLDVKPVVKPMEVKPLLSQSTPSQSLKVAKQEKLPELMPIPAAPIKDVSPVSPKDDLEIIEESAVATPSVDMTLDKLIAESKDTKEKVVAEFPPITPVPVKAAEQAKVASAATKKPASDILPEPDLEDLSFAPFDDAPKMPNPAPLTEKAKPVLPNVELPKIEKVNAEKPKTLASSEKSKQFEEIKREEKVAALDKVMPSDDKMLADLEEMPSLDDLDALPVIKAPEIKKLEVKDSDAMMGKDIADEKAKNDKPVQAVLDKVLPPLNDSKLLPLPEMVAPKTVAITKPEPITLPPSLPKEEGGFLPNLKASFGSFLGGSEKKPEVPAEIASAKSSSDNIAPVKIESVDKVTSQANNAALNGLPELPTFDNAINNADSVSGLPPLPSFGGVTNPNDKITTDEALPPLPFGNEKKDGKVDAPTLPKMDAEKEVKLASLDKNTDSPLPPLTEPLLGSTEEGTALSVFFSQSETEVPLAFQQPLITLSKELVGNDSKIKVIAYASGSDDQKSIARRISLARALAVRAFLIDLGVDNVRISVQALGNDVKKGPSERADVMIAPKG